ncbi:MAG TPA: hypothetical protein IAB18_10440 [Candidatus Avisuccinivibrio pullicola]|nr:hypothetical protein [Candidatus Avisuccinivibrio pullicola]
MSLSHTLHHMERDVSLWRLNHRLVKGIRNRELTLTEDGFTFTHATRSMVKEIESLHLQLFRVPLINWIRWVYKFHVADLVSVILDKDGHVAGYDMFIFNEGEWQDRILHEPFVGVDPKYQGLGLSTKLRRYSVTCYNFGILNGLSTVAAYDDIKALRSAQKSGYGIVKASAKPSGHYLVCPLTLRR